MGVGAQKITEDHDLNGRACKKLAKMKVLIKDIITPGISCQQMVKEVKSLQWYFWVPGATHKGPVCT